MRPTAQTEFGANSSVNGASRMMSDGTHLEKRKTAQPAVLPKPKGWPAVRQVVMAGLRQQQRFRERDSEVPDVVQYVRTLSSIFFRGKAVNVQSPDSSQVYYLEDNQGLRNLLNRQSAKRVAIPQVRAEKQTRR